MFVVFVLTMCLMAVGILVSELNPMYLIIAVPLVAVIPNMVLPWLNSYVGSVHLSESPELGMSHARSTSPPSSVVTFVGFTLVP